MNERLAVVLQHFESEAVAADQLGLSSPAGSDRRIKHFAERDTYRYVLKQLRSTQPEQKP